MSTEPPGEANQPSNQPLSLSLDSDCDNPTRWEKRVSQSNAADSDLAGDTQGDLDGGLSHDVSDSDGSGSEPEPDEWGRQQKRVFHRVNTLLHYWESRDYDIVWVTLTSCPESDPASELAYNVQRLRQTIERAKLAYDGEGEAHRLSHITELEQLAIRTSEGPEGKGVVHLFWAWEPPEGNHSKDLYIPQNWLARQWGRIHGPHKLRSPGDLQTYTDAGTGIEPLYVWIEEYGAEDYHDRKSVARYCVTQYLGEHAEALEHVSWSHGRTLGGSLLEAWQAVRKHREELAAAVETWETVIAGESVKLGSQSENVDYAITVEPPPELGVEVVEDVSVTPPEDYQQQGPDVMMLRTVTRSLPEYDGGRCPECNQGGVFQLSEDFEKKLHPDNRSERAHFYCLSCDTELAGMGGGGSEVVERELETWDVSPAGSEPGKTDSRPEMSGRDVEVRGSALYELSREGEVFEPPEWSQKRVREYAELNPGATVPEVLGRFGISPERQEDVREVLADV